MVPTVVVVVVQEEGHSLPLGQKEGGSNQKHKDYGMATLHILTRNPHATPDCIVACYAVDPSDLLALDKRGLHSLDYARAYNVQGLLALIEVLCMHLRSSCRKNYVKAYYDLWTDKSVSA